MSRRALKGRREAPNLRLGRLSSTWWGRGRLPPEGGQRLWSRAWARCGQGQLSWRMKTASRGWSEAEVGVAGLWIRARHPCEWLGTCLAPQVGPDLESGKRNKRKLRVH